MGAQLLGAWTLSEPEGLLVRFYKMHHSSLLKLYSAVLSSTSLTILLYLLHGNLLRLKGLTISQFLLAAWLTL